MSEHRFLFRNRVLIFFLYSFFYWTRTLFTHQTIHLIIHHAFYRAFSLLYVLLLCCCLHCCSSVLCVQSVSVGAIARSELHRRNCSPKRSVSYTRRLVLGQNRQDRAEARGDHTRCISMDISFLGFIPLLYF